MTRRVRLRVGLALLFGLVIAAALPVIHPPLGLEVWRRASRLAYADETGTITLAGGQEIAWAAVGEGEPLLIVHGLRGELTVMLPLARELAREGYRAVLIDLPGHGHSPLAPDVQSIGDAARVVLQASAALGLGKRPALVGHSLGAWIVAWAALASPEQVGAVVLLAPPGLAYEPPPYPLLMPRTPADVERALPLLFAEPRWVPWPVRRITTGRDPRASLALLRSASSGAYLLDGLLAGWSVPLLVVHGDEDGIVPARIGRQIARKAGGRYVEMDGVSHMLIWEDPREIARIIAEAGQGAGRR